MSASDWPKLASTLAQLEGLYTYTLATNTLSVVPGPFGYVDAATRQGNSDQLKFIRSRLDRLGPIGGVGSGVVAGTVTAERWIAMANELGAALNRILATLEQESGRFWREVVVKTGEDIAGMAKDAALGGGIGVGLVVAAIIALKVLK